MSTEIIWKKMRDPLLKYVLYRVKDEAIAADIVQDVFVKIQIHLKQLKDYQKLKGWIYQIARNATADYFRKEKKGLPTLEEAPSVEPPYDIQGDLNHELAQWLPDAIDLLPEKYREAIYLTEIVGLSQKELSERLGISYSGAKSRVQRGREKLKDIILQCCEVITDTYGNVLDYHPKQTTKKNCTTEAEDCVC